MRLFFTLFLLHMVLLGVELTFDTTYTGPKKLTVSSLGVSMGLPKHWSALATKGKGLKLFQETSQDVILMRSKSMTRDEALRYLNMSHTLNGTKVFPQERVVRLNSRIYRRAFTSNGGIKRPAYLAYVVSGPQERTILVWVTYDRTHESSIKATSMSLVQALSFTPTRQLQTAQQDLRKRLKGVHLSYLKRDGAYDDKRELWLCSNKRYLLIESRTVAGGMSRVKEQKLGSWKVEEEALILHGDDGLDRIIVVELKGNALFFDGIRSFELPNHQCP